MNLQPILEDELIILRPIKQEDFDDLFEAASDPEIWEQHPNKDRYKREEFEKYFVGAIESKGALVVIDKLTGDVIGCSRYYDYDKERKRVAIGWTFLVKRCWGGKYNRSLKKLMMDNAFEDFEEIIFHIGENNIRSRKAVEKIGGKLLDEDYEEEGHVVYGIRKRD
ncbi:MAG TPA: GNAT family N-acetyltransferase [Ignavibacteria bacterium]|nr:GNAT family N-acetyltransferase [Ignavibacteria bacterium]